MSAEPIRILIVDDSRLFRSALEEALRDQPGVAIAGSVFSGEKALAAIRESPPDLVTLDVEMPGMDGLQTLEQIQTFNRSRPGGRPVGVIMVSAFTRRGERVTIDALQAGAFDFVAKPSGASADENIATLRAELLAKIRAFALSQQRRAPGGPAVPPPAGRRPVIKRSRYRAVVIGASTGGPRALSDMLPALCGAIDLPILIVQHMPAGFTKTLADSLSRRTGKTVVEAAEAMPLEPSAVYVAPGGKHLLMRGSGTSIVTALNEQPPENGCRPSADVLFRSAASVLGGEAVAVILTGMGRDGTVGLGAVRRAGGHVIAQDEASSVVWGMPGSAVEAGVVDEVHPLDRIAAAVAAVVNRKGVT